jgi:hypothetical protein
MDTLNDILSRVDLPILVKYLIPWYCPPKFQYAVIYENSIEFVRIYLSTHT